MNPRAMLSFIAVVLLTGCVTVDPDTPRQAKMRADLEACNTATGNQSYDIKVSPDGRYFFRTTGYGGRQAMFECLRDKGYSPRRLP